MTDEIKKTEVEEHQAPALANPPEESVGEIMEKSKSEGVKFWVIVFSAFVYLTGIVYAEVHGLAMLQNGIRPDLRIWAAAGMIAAGITAVLLPVALKVWTIEAKQRLAAYGFYLLDFAFLCFNAFTDFNTNTGQQLTGWAQTYVTYVLPASPILVAAGWALLWELDPSVKAKVIQLSLRAAMKEKEARRVAAAAKGPKVDAMVNAAAEREVERALTELFGAPVTTYRIPAGYEPQPRGLGKLLQSFFASMHTATRGAPMPPQSDKSD